MRIDHWRLSGTLLLLVCLFFASTPAMADLIYPARLEIREVEPGLFEVFFVLPVMQGKVLNARPVLPAVCIRLSEPQVTGDANMKISRWRVSSQPDSLYGKEIGIEGLLGSQVDILFSLQMLNGRSYQKMLSPVNAFFLVPRPPGILDITGKALLQGLRSVLQHGALFLLILILSITNTKRALPFTSMLVLAMVGFMAGQQLTAVQWLMVPENLPVLTTLLITLLLSLLFIYRSAADSFIFWWLPVLLGVAYGSVDYIPDFLGGYNLAEQTAASFISFVGSGIAVLIMYWLSVNIVYLIIYFVKKSDEVFQATVYGTGIISFGLVGYLLTPYLFTVGPYWTIPILPVAFILVLSFWTVHSNLHQRFKAITFTGLVLLFLLAGVTLSLTGLLIDGPVMMILMAILVIVIYLGFNAVPSWWFNLLVSGGGTVMCGYYMSQLASENLSYANAQIIGFVVILGLVYILGNQMAQELSAPIVHIKPVRLSLVILMVGFIGIFWFREFLQAHWSQLVLDYSTGLLPVPVVSLLLVLLALWFWPRYRSIHQSIGLKRRAPIFSMIFLGLALFLFPWFTLKAKNPFSGTGLPDLDRAEVIVQQLLSNTYHAFNLEDEDQLYEQLTQSIDQELIEDIYLDSRRKLRAGVRQGAEVLVKEVALLEIDNSSPGAGDDLLHFDTRWMVTARVKHLQHIHHRQNLYTGLVELKMEDAQWKISRINLLSEDRTVIPNTGG